MGLCLPWRCEELAQQPETFHLLLNTLVLRARYERVGRADGCMVCQ